MSSKLYAFQPNGHGEQSFFVLAENENQARNFIDVYIAEKYTDSKLRIAYEARGWGTNYYIMTVANIGEIIENDNS